MRVSNAANLAPVLDQELKLCESVSMREELLCLLGGLSLGFFHILVASAAATRERGVQWNFSSRGGKQPPLSGVASRLKRASDNFRETFPLFLASVVLLGLAGRFGQLSVAGSLIYLGARCVYLPLYAFDITHVRTAVWLISLGGILLNVAQFIL